LNALAFGREPLEPGAAVDEQDAERLFELLYAGRQGRLGYATDLCSTAEMPFAG